MSIDVTRLHPLFFARLDGVDLANVDAAAFDAIEDAFAQHRVLHFPAQKLTQEQHVAFSRRLGPLEVVTMGASIDGGRSTLPEINRVSNLTLDNKIRAADDLRRKYSKGNQLWHTDSTYQHIPSKCSLLYAHKVPSKGGNTEFADMQTAYDDLPEAMKRRIDGLLVEHSIFTSRAKIGFSDFSAESRAAHPVVQQVLVRVHPVTGRRSLYLASHASHIIGWPQDEGRALLAELIEHATQPKYVHSHKWTAGDLVMWDNRHTMHRAMPFESLDEERDLHRTTVQDIGNTVELLQKKVA